LLPPLVAVAVVLAAWQGLHLAGVQPDWVLPGPGEVWRSLMAAEIIATSASLGHGLGQLLKQAQDTNDMALAFGAIALVLVVGIGVNQLVFSPLERRVLLAHGLSTVA